MRHFRSLATMLAVCSCLILGRAAAAPLRPVESGRLHVLSIETDSVAGADVDASSIHSIAKDWVDSTSPQNAGFRSQWRQTKQGAGPAGIRGAVLRKIGELRDHVQNGDVLLFYYSGHGATDQDGRHLLQFDDGGYLHRDDVFQRLQALGGRLTLLVTDCCASRIKLPVIPEEGAGPTDPQPQHRQLRENLARLFQASGFYDVNSANPGQIAWGTNSGGLFTGAFVDVLREKPVKDWDHFTTLTVAETESAYVGFRKLRLDDPKARSEFSANEIALLQTQKTQRPFRFLHLRDGVEGALTARPPRVGNPLASGGIVDQAAEGVTDSVAPRPPVGVLPPAVGVVITRVTPGTSATKLDLDGAEMMLEAGDRILVVNGRPIQSKEHFSEVIDSLGRGAPITLIILSGPNEERMQLRGKLDLGGKYRLGVTVNDR